ncbi:MAG: TrkA C-terminal domain-containing protein [Halobacteria archaeon]|nr:TrkA C-terminal domain-containing protein [Halobacteria archaeon]
MALVNDILLGLYLGILTGIVPALVAWGLGFLFKYFTGVTLPGFGVVVLGVALAGVQGGLLGLTDPAVAASTKTLVALIVVMMLTLYAHSKGDQMGVEFPRRISLRSLRETTISTDVVEIIGGFGQVRVHHEGDIGNIEGYPPLPSSLRAEIGGESWMFPSALSIDEMEKRLAERLTKEYDLSEVEVSIDSQAKARINAAPPMGGVSKRVPEGRRTVSVDVLVPTGIARGDEVVIRAGDKGVSGTVVSATSDIEGSNPPTTTSEETDETSSKPVTAPTTEGGDGRITLAVSPDEARTLLSLEPSEIERAVVKSRGKRREFELVSLLKQGGKRFERFSVATNSSLAGRTLSESTVRDTYGVAVLGIKRSGDWIVSPSGSTSLESGDELLVVGKPDALGGFEEVVR